MSKYISAKEFYDMTIGRGVDIDGAYGVQCVDLFNYFNSIVNDCYIGCSPSGYAKSIFENRANNGVLQYFDVVPLSQVKKGDWCIWENCECSPKSHVAMFWESHNETYGKFLGQNQGGVREANTGIVEYNGIIGVLRPKIYANEQVDAKTPTSNFLGNRGWLTFGDKGENVRKICDFMYNTFPAYDKVLNRDKNDLLGNCFGPNLRAWIIEFQKRTGLEADGNIGPLTLAKLKEYGFKE